ncbi:LOW QUALITY PROTEIN: hypothetical protein V2J09_004356 [Rumex salicifolius]
MAFAQYLALPVEHYAKSPVFSSSSIPCLLTSSPSSLALFSSFETSVDRFSLSARPRRIGGHGIAKTHPQDYEASVAADAFTHFKHVLLPVTDRNPYLSEGTRQAAATTTALAKNYGADITLLMNIRKNHFLNMKLYLPAFVGTYLKNRRVRFEAAMIGALHNSITEQIQTGFAAALGEGGGSTPIILKLSSSLRLTSAMPENTSSGLSEENETPSAALVARKVELSMFDGEDEAGRPCQDSIGEHGRSRAELGVEDWTVASRLFVGGTQGGVASNRLKNSSLLRQTGFLDDYVDEIVACAAHTIRIGNDQLLWLAGIRPKIRDIELSAAMDGARRVESKLNFSNGLGRGT